MLNYSEEEKRKQKKFKIGLIAVVAIISLSIIGVGLYKGNKFVQEKKEKYNINNLFENIEKQLN